MYYGQHLQYIYQRLHDPERPADGPFVDKLTDKIARKATRGKWEKVAKTFRGIEALADILQAVEHDELLPS